VKVLLDTHALLWAFQDHDKLSQKAKDVFLNPDNALFLSMASYWEICLKQSVGKLELAKNWRETIERELSENSIAWLKIEKVHCEGLLKLPWQHRDPFDRLLIVQAQLEGMTILTVDENIQSYKVKTIW
jgi:PIN domain nuclease of toxin-antitoxin system